MSTALASSLPAPHPCASSHARHGAHTTDLPRRGLHFDAALMLLLWSILVYRYLGLVLGGLLVVCSLLLFLLLLLLVLLLMLVLPLLLLLLVLPLLMLLLLHRLLLP